MTNAISLSEVNTYLTRKVFNQIFLDVIIERIEGEVTSTTVLQRSANPLFQ